LYWPFDFDLKEMQMNRGLLFATIALAVVSCIPAAAGTVTFTAPCSTCYTNYSPTYTDAATGTTFTIASGTINVTGKDYYGPVYDYPADFLIEATDAFGVDNVLTVKLPGVYTNFSVSMGSYSDGTCMFTLSDGTTGPITPAGFGTVGTYSISSATGISWATLAIPAGDSFILTTLSFTGSTPEPGSLALLGSGVLAVVGVFRRRLLR